MLKKSLIIATGITLTLFGIILYIGTLYGQYNPGTGTQYPPKNLGQGSRDFGYFFHEVGTAATYTEYFGTQSVTGSGTAGRIAGTSSALPHIEYNYVGGTPTFNFVGGTLQNEGVDVTVSSDLTGYIAVTGGTGTGNVLTNTTLDGTGTISANVSLSGNITANSLEITPTELSYINNASSEIQAQITTATGSITNHTHTGSDGTAQIAHDSVTGTGTNSHTTIDAFITSKAQSSGLASLDANSLVVENPASGTTTSTASSIPISDGSGKIADDWLNSTVTLLGQNIELGTETTGTTDNVSEGSTNLYYQDSRVNAAVGSLTFNTLADVVITSPAENHKISYSGGNWVNATDTAIVDWSGITGIPTENGSVSTTSGAGYIPVAGSDGKLDYGWSKDVLRLPGTTTSPEAGAYGQLYVQSSSSSSSSGSGDAYTKLLLRMNNPGTTTFVDSSASAFTITVNGNAIGTSSAKYGSGAGYFDGTGDYITTIDHVDLEPLAADFTVEAWVKTTTGANGQTPFAKPSGAAGSMATYSVYVDGGNYLLYMSSNGTSWDVVSGGNMGACTANVWTHLAISRQGSNIRYFKDGTQMGTTTSAATLHDAPYGVWIGGTRDNSGFVNPWTGYVDEFCFTKDSSRYNTNFIPSFYGNKNTQYSAKYDDPINGNTVFEILTPGTATTEASYIYCNATTTVFGLGTNTAITGTSTAYSGWFDGAVRATAFNVASSEKIKDNLKKIKIVDTAEAENTAKSGYVNSNKPAWIAANEVNYTYVGTDSASYVDTAAMNTAYDNYIETEWASDLNQPVYIKNVEKEYEKGFWQKFNLVQPKSWSPKGDPSVVRKGFVAEEMPDEVKGQDKQSIDPMALIAYISLVVQELKDASLLNFKAIEELLTTGTITSGKLIKDRIEVLETVP